MRTITNTVNQQQSTALRHPRIILAGIMCLALILRMHDLGRASIWLDEAVSVHMAQMGWRAFLVEARQSEANMILYYFLLRFWIFLGDSEAVVRMLSVISSVATIPAIYALGSYLFDRKVGLLAALLLSVNAFHIRYAQEARSYALLVLLLTLAGLFFARTLKRNSYADWGLWVLLSVLAVYSQFMAAVTLSAYAVSLLFVRARDVPWKRMAVGWAGIGIAVSPLIYHALRRGTGPIAWIQPPGRPDLYKLLRFLTGAGGKWLLLLYACFIIVAVASLRQGGGARRRRFDGWAVWFLFTWLLLPIFLVLAISLKQPLLVPRYLIGCLPPLVLLAAIGVEQVHPTALRVAAVSVIVALALSAVLEYYRGLSQYYKDDWRSATNYLLDNTRRGDTVLIYRAYGRLPLAYYLRRRPAPFNVIPVRGGGDTALLASISYSRVWLVLCHCHSDAEGRRLESVVAGHSTPTEEVRFPGLRVVLFEQGGVPAELSGCADKPRDQ